MDESYSSVSQHGQRLHHQQQPIDGQEEDLDSPGVDVVPLQLLEGEVSQQNEPGDVDKEQQEEGGIPQCLQGLVDLVVGCELCRHWLQPVLYQVLPEIGLLVV